jgi:phage FluMu protein Com
MLEKGTRRVRCGNEQCGKMLEFRINTSMYNTTQKVRCPSCREVWNVSIPQPAETNTTVSSKPKSKSESELLELFFPSFLKWP